MAHDEVYRLVYNRTLLCSLQHKLLKERNKDSSKIILKCLMSGEVDITTLFIITIFFIITKLLICCPD